MDIIPVPKHPENPTEPWFVYVDPRDVAQAVELAIETQDVMYGSYHVVAGREDSRFDWKQTARGTRLSPGTQLARNSRETLITGGNRFFHESARVKRKVAKAQGRKVFSSRVLSSRFPVFSVSSVLSV